MSRLRFFLGEVRNEFVAGIMNGVALLILAIMTAYICLMMTSAGYIANMSGADVQRNAPSLAYMFAVGDNFFLFFAWAWLFAQPIIRDRSANLHEIVFTAPVSLRLMLAARFFGAFGVATVIGASPIIGFALAPLLETFGMVPPGSMGPTPWLALGWGWLIFTVPTAAGAGALYFMAAMRTRSAGGPFAVSAILILCWMIAIIVLGEAGLRPTLQTIIDPSCFTEVERLVSEWTPTEKATILYPISSDLILNRLVWVVLPLLLLANAIMRVTREKLVLERETKKRNELKSVAAGSRPLLPPIAQASWVSALVAEICWQISRILESRAFWFLLAGLVSFGFVSAFYHMIYHADGPFVPRPENTPSLLTTVLYVFMLFIAAAMAGFVMRRDDREGFGEMMDAAPAPEYVRLVGRCITVAFVTIALALVPAVSAVLAALVAAPEHVSILTPILHQLFETTPPLLETAAISIVAHAVIRKSGIAYAASMLGAWIALVNNETAMVEYPPFQFAVLPSLPLSGLTGWGIWSERIALFDSFKLFVILTMMSISGILMTRGADSRLVRGARLIRTRLFSPIGVTLVASLFAAAFLYERMGVEYALGGYRSSLEEKAQDAAWETRWLPYAKSTFDITGGHVMIAVDPVAQSARGTWVLQNVSAGDRRLHAELPHGVTLQRVLVNEQSVRPLVEYDHAMIPLDVCEQKNCEVTIEWAVDGRGWLVEPVATIMAEAKREPAWVSPKGVWLMSARIMPRLGFNEDRILRAPADRAAMSLPVEPSVPMRGTRVAADNAVAPGGDWHWEVAIKGGSKHAGRIYGPLAFAALWSPNAVSTSIGGIRYMSDHSRVDMVEGVAVDVVRMQECVGRRMSGSARIEIVAQLPRGLAKSELLDGALLLSEDPHWDIVGTGAGRWRRQATIAEVIARRRIIDVANVRSGEGAQWLTNGLAGAIGMMCSVEQNGLKALHRLVERAAERTTTAIGANKTPITTLAGSADEDWVKEYAPLATLAWVAQATPQQVDTLLQLTSQNGDVALALQKVAGADLATQLLGPPQQSDVSIRGGYGAVSRQRWIDGGWRSIVDHGPVLQFSEENNRISVRQTPIEALEKAQAGSIIMDSRASYERSLVDNVIKHQGTID